MNIFWWWGETRAGDNMETPCRESCHSLDLNPGPSGCEVTVLLRCRAASWIIHLIWKLLYEPIHEQIYQGGNPAKKAHTRRKLDPPPLLHLPHPSHTHVHTLTRTHTGQTVTLHQCTFFRSMKFNYEKKMLNHHNLLNGSKMRCK